MQWVMHLVIGGSEEQLAQIIQEADADLDEVITTVSQVIYLLCVTAAAAYDQVESERAREFVGQ